MEVEAVDEGTVGKILIGDGAAQAGTCNSQGRFGGANTGTGLFSRANIQSWWCGGQHPRNHAIATCNGITGLNIDTQQLPADRRGHDIGIANAGTRFLIDRHLHRHALDDAKVDRHRARPEGPSEQDQQQQHNAGKNDRAGSQIPGSHFLLSRLQRGNKFKPVNIALHQPASDQRRNQHCKGSAPDIAEPYLCRDRVKIG
jgi:hypothetical protein